MLNEQIIILNLVPGEVPPMAYVTQDDVGRLIKLVLIDGDAAYNLSPSYTYSLRGTKPSGTGFSYDDAITVSGSNILTFKTNSVMTAVEGRVRCGVVIYDGDEHVETLNFILMVQKSALGADTITDSEEYQRLLGVGVPRGGTAGQVLAKKTNEDFITEWVDQTGGGGTIDYEELDNLPSINGVELTGNKSAVDLGLKQVFWATYGTTAYSELSMAKANGMLVVCKKLDDGLGTPERIYVLSKQSGNSFLFTNVEEPDSVRFLLCNASGWSTGTGSLSASDVGAIAAPSSPASGAFLVYDGSAWVAKTLTTWQGGNY